MTAALPLPHPGARSARHWAPVLLVAGVHTGLLALLALTPPQTPVPVPVPDIAPVQLLDVVETTPAPVPVVHQPRKALAPAPPPTARQRVKPAPVAPTLRLQTVPALQPAAAGPAAPRPVVAAATAPAPPSARATHGGADTPAEAQSAPTVELPSTRAAYLSNPRPPYPPSSRRMGETGTVQLRVLVGVDGSAERVSLRHSSGFDALDQSALATVQRWRFAPGKRNGIPVAMEYTVPITFRLD